MTLVSFVGKILVILTILTITDEPLLMDEFRADLTVLLRRHVNHVPSCYTGLSGHHIGIILRRFRFNHLLTSADRH